jgi:hypothetical protein
MKTIKILILFFFLTGVLGCKNDDDTIGINNPDVETYIQLIKANQYESSQLPEFTSKDIPALLEYLNDESVISKFPHNPISSYYAPNPDYRLGILVLWTIESIRVAAYDDSNLILGLPSQHPFVKTRSEPVEWITNHEDNAYDVVRQSYVKWWNENKHKKFINFCRIDPLESTNYRWH